MNAKSEDLQWGCNSHGFRLGLSKYEQYSTYRFFTLGPEKRSIVSQASVDELGRDSSNDGLQTSSNSV